MAHLSDTDRARIWRGLMRWWSAQREEVGPITKQQLRDAVDATDAWIDDNQASYNSVLPAVARNNLTMLQKTLLFMAVAAMRVGVGFLRKLLGEVD